MKARKRTAVALIALLTVAAALPHAAGAAPPARAPYIVVYHRSLPNPDAETHRQQSARGFAARLRFGHAVKGFAARLTPSQVAGLRRDPGVAAVVPDRPVHALASFPLAAGDSAEPGIRRIGAATATTVRGASDVSVAVLDTGIDLDHPDLNAVDGTNCVTPPGPGNPHPPAEDDAGHGTHVAGIIGARNNGSGVVGVAPGTRTVAVKVLDSGGNGSMSTVICGLDWVAAHATALDIGVANMSLGGAAPVPPPCGADGDDVLHEAVCGVTAAGVTPVVSAGNNAEDFATQGPANEPEALTVTAYTDRDGAGGGAAAPSSCRPEEQDDNWASFSNFASAASEGSHTLSAPGICISSTWLGGGYHVLSGTSQASPHVAGLVALCLSEAGVAGPCAGKDPAAVIQRMRAVAAGAAGDASFGFSGDPLRPVVADHYFGYSASAALTGPLGTPIDAPPPPPPPPAPVTSTAVDQPAAAAPAARLPQAGAGPTATIARRRIASVLKRGLRVSVACSQACAARSEALLRSHGRTTRVGKGAAKLLSTHPVVTIAFSKAQRVRLAKARTLKLTIRTRIDVAGRPARYVKQTVTLRR